jgi:hypothetical protein
MNAAPTTLREALCQALLSTAKVNRAVQAPPEAVLWPDRDAIWQPAIRVLQACLPSLVVYGAYDPEHRTGPAIWLKCAIAGQLPEVDLQGQVPVIYLPGVPRSDLRAIESCPRELQPLAELQYRGLFWSQENGKDWTLNAFCLSDKGGLGLDVAQDRATQEALLRALAAGVLLERPIADLKSRQINAEWLDALLAPNPARDILVWLNNPKQAEAEWAGGHWQVFASRCKQDFGFDPKADGELVAADKLAAHAGAWVAVWELYQDSFTSFPNVVDLLDRVQPPKLNLWVDRSGYPQSNADDETMLRGQLAATGSMNEQEARDALHGSEDYHGQRREWLWARMGRAPLAQALVHLVQVADLTAQPLGAASLEQMAEKYRDGAWRIDAAAMSALATVPAKADVDAVSKVLHALYVPWLERMAKSFQKLVVAAGGLHSTPPVQQGVPNGTCLVFVDGLRYDVACELAGRLQTMGKVTLSSAWTSLPSVTASGKAWASPVAHLIQGKPTDQEFEPSVAESGKPLSAYYFRKLLADSGFQVLEQRETGDPTGKAWVEYGDLDHYGHEHGIRLARDLSVQLDQIVERLAELAAAGWTRLQIVTDHGWLLVPDALPKVDLSHHQAQTRWGRCAVLKEYAGDTPLTFGWDWCKTVQIACAPGIGSFISGKEYDHGGLSLQESLVPVLDVDLGGAVAQNVKVEITSVTWKRLRCYVEVAPDISGLRVDMRTKAAQPESSVVENVRPLEAGKASLAIADDELIGTAAVVVVLNTDGTVVQKMATTIGG